MADKLRYAILNCRSIDMDNYMLTRNTDNAMEIEEDEPVLWYYPRVIFPQLGGIHKALLVWYVLKWCYVIIYHLVLFVYHYQNLKSLSLIPCPAHLAKHCMNNLFNDMSGDSLSHTHKIRDYNAGLTIRG